MLCLFVCLYLGVLVCLLVCSCDCLFVCLFVYLLVCLLVLMLMCMHMYMCMCMSMIMVFLSKNSVSHDHVFVAVQQPPAAFIKKTLAGIYVYLCLCMYYKRNRRNTPWQAVSCSKLTRRDLLLMMREGGWGCSALLRSGWVLDPQSLLPINIHPLAPPDADQYVRTPVPRYVF